MNTYEARTTMLDMAVQALSIIEKLQSGTTPNSDMRRELRQMLIQAREALADAGYPGDAVWRALQRASIGADTFLDQSDPVFWTEIGSDLKTAIETLESLVSPHFRRESDFHIVS